MTVIKPCKFYKFIILTLLILLSSYHGKYLNAENHSTEAWKFAVISDTQGNNRDNNKSCINDKIVSLVAADIVTEKPDFILVAGDLVNGWFRNSGTDYDTQYTNWRSAMKPVYSAGIRVYPVRGNHDSGPERLALPPLPSHLEPPPGTPEKLKAAFIKAFPESYIPDNGPEGEKRLAYSFIHKNVFIIGLDEYSVTQHKINQDWLNSQLASNKLPHVFIFGHEPAFEVNHIDNLSYFKNDRDIFWDSIGKAGAKIYFCGHDHFYNRALIPDSKGNDIRQIILSSSGGSIRKWSGSYKENKKVKGEYNNSEFHGYVLVYVDRKKIIISWKALTDPDTNKWQDLDTFTYVVTSK